MRQCELCSHLNDDEAEVCTKDGGPLHPPDPLLGQIIEKKYQVNAILDSGGMGRVYKAIDINLRRPCALKIIRMDSQAIHGLEKRFRREAEAAARLNHENIITIYGYGIAESVGAYIIMEYLDGCSLHKELRVRAYLPVSETVSLVQQICLALKEAQNHGVIHRDIKPENIFLKKRNGSTIIKILDFGLAKFQVVPEAQEETPTGPNVVLGTPKYMAPELGKGEQGDIRSDIYSIGTVFYEMLTGITPFKSDNPYGYFHQKLNNDPLPPSQIRPGIPKEMDNIILCALAKDPAKRYQKVEEFEDALRLLNVAHLDNSVSRIDNVILESCPVGALSDAATKIAQSKPSEETLPQPMHLEIEALGERGNEWPQIASPSSFKSEIQANTSLGSGEEIRSNAFQKEAVIEEQTEPDIQKADDLTENGQRLQATNNINNLAEEKESFQFIKWLRYVLIFIEYKTIGPKYSVWRWHRMNQLAHAGRLVLKLTITLSILVGLYVLVPHVISSKLKVRFYYGIGELASAKAVIARAKTSQPEDPYFYDINGRILQSEGNYREAEAEFRKATEIGPNFCDYHSDLAQVLAKQRNYAEAVIEYQKALQLDPNDPDHHSGLGQVYLNQRNFDDANTSFEAALKINPNVADYHFGRGMALYALNDYNAAELEFREAIRTERLIDPNMSKHYLNHGKALFMQGKYNKAELQIKMALRLDPNDPEGRKVLDEIYKATGPTNGFSK